MSCCLYVGAICDHFDFLCDSIMKDVEWNRFEKDSKKQRQRNQQIREKIGQMIHVHVKMFEYVNFDFNESFKIQELVFYFVFVFSVSSIF